MGDEAMEVTNDAPRRGRPPIHSREEVRAACVEAGRDALRDHGLDLRLDGVTLEAAAQAAGISRAAAFRAWSGDRGGGPQARFRRTVAGTVLSDFVETRDAVASAAIDVMAKATGHDGLDVIAGAIEAMRSTERERLFARVVAAGAMVNIRDLAANSLWHTRIGLLASVRSQEEPDPELRDAVASGESNMADRHVELYRFVLGMFGMRLREGYRYEQLAAAAGCLAEGLALRRMSPYAISVDRPMRGADGDLTIDADTSWNLFGAACMGLIHEFCEPDPAAPDPTDPSRC